MNLGDLPSALFSSAKMIFIGFVVLAALCKMHVPLCVFILFSVCFFFFEIAHNDYGRICLNRLAKKHVSDPELERQIELKKLEIEKLKLEKGKDG